MGWYEVDLKEFDDLQQKIEEYGDKSKRVVDEVLHGEGAVQIKDEISRILPASGRKWKGKSRPASVAMPGSFAQDDDVMSVTIAARGTYHYLYFPDDGTNTDKHIGNQQFMKQGADAATPDIIELCTGRIVEEL